MPAVAQSETYQVPAYQRDAWKKTAAQNPDGITKDLGTQCFSVDYGMPYGPVMYRAADLGKPGIPRLRADQLQTLATVRRYVRSKDLRFSLLEPGSELVVFVGGGKWHLCSGARFLVLNANCDTTYSPLEGATRVEIYCADPARPWYPADRTLMHLRDDPSFWTNYGE